MHSKDLHKFSNGDVYFWIEQDSSVMLKASTKEGDPVELEAREVRKIAEGLLNIAAELEKL